VTFLEYQLAGMAHPAVMRGAPLEQELPHAFVFPKPSCGETSATNDKALEQTPHSLPLMPLILCEIQRQHNLLLSLEARLFPFPNFIPGSKCQKRKFFKNHGIFTGRKFDVITASNYVV